MLDPCSGSDDIASAPLQLLVQALVGLGRRRFPVLNTYREGILLATSSLFRLALLRPSASWCGVDLKACAVFRFPFTSIRVLGLSAHGAPLGPSDAEHRVGTRPSASICPEKCVLRFVRTTAAPIMVGSSRLGSCRVGVGEECYLVDPASSHMLVSKIKPCMCKYELIQTVKLRMAH